MRSSLPHPFKSVAGNVNLKGKKLYRCSCGCCNVRNMKDEYVEKMAKKEVLERLGHEFETIWDENVEKLYEE